jgi:hypothetical protein
MIELPSENYPMTAAPRFIDYGFLQRGAIGSQTKRIDRKGSRYMIAVSMGPFTPTTARLLVARLISAKSEGIRIPYPLLESQSGCGSPLVDGAGQTGTTLALKALTAGYTCREGYWLSIEDQNGRHYLHNVKTGGRAASDGTLSIVISPELRWPFLNNAAVHLAKPYIEGFVDGDAWDWELSGSRTMPIGFTIEEAA